MPECHSECYVEYFNLFPDITHKLNSFSDVSDGLLLGELLRSMSYFIMLGNL